MMTSNASRLFIPLNCYSETSSITNCENISHFRNINGATVFENNRVKRRRCDSESDVNHKPVPWKKRDHYEKNVMGLHREINDFYETMQPTMEENEIRSIVVSHIQQTVNSLWPQAKVHVFGSFNTGLYLPSSDIDIVVTGEWDNLPLNTLRTALVRSGIDDKDISILSTAAVPLVRLVHTLTKLKVDISFNVPNGIKSADLIKDFMRRHPALPKIVMVLKQFLLHRGLNEVYYGGLSSYALTLLVISFLQGHHKPNALPGLNLGTLLIEFFELYGLNFNYDKVSISIKNGGSYFPKLNPWSSYLSIEDPLCSSNDIAKGSYLMKDIKHAFENAYNTLHKAVTDTGHDIRAPSMLQLILDVDANIFLQRQWTKDSFEEILKHFPFYQKSVYQKKDWKENVERLDVPFSAADQKDGSQCSGGSSSIPEEAVTQKHLAEERKRPLQKTRIFYGSRNAAIQRNADYGDNHQPGSKNAALKYLTANKSSPNSTEIGKKYYRVGKKGPFKQGTNNCER